MWYVPTLAYLWYLVKFQQNRIYCLLCLLSSSHPNHPPGDIGIDHATSYLLPILTHLLPFCTVHHSHPTPLHTTPPVNTTPMSRSHSPPVLSQIQAYNHTIKSTPFNFPLPSFHPTILRSLHTEMTFYLPQLPPATAPIIIPIADPASPTHIPHTNSYVVLLLKESCTCISIPAHHAPSTSHMRTPGSHVTTHM